MSIIIDKELDDKKPLIVSGMKILLNEQSLKVLTITVCTCTLYLCITDKVNVWSSDHHNGPSSLS